MAFYGVTPPSNDLTLQDIGDITIGISKIFVDASFVGSLKEGTGAVWNYNAMDKNIVTGNFPGTVLGKRNLGESPTITFEAIESTLQNIRQFLDLRATVSNNKLGMGRRNKVATVHSMDIYGEAPLQRTRHIQLYRVTLEVDGDINIADPEDFTTFRVIARILPQTSLPEATWYGEIIDSPPA